MKQSRRKDFVTLKNKKYGCLKVIGEDTSGNVMSGCRVLYKCVCSCGRETYGDRWALESHHKTRCEYCAGVADRKPILADKRAIQINNTSGYKGVDFNNGKWRARIYFNNKAILLGSFATKEEAIAVRKAAETIICKLI